MLARANVAAVATILAMSVLLASPHASPGANEDLAGSVQIQLLTSDAVDGTTIFARATGPGQVALLGAVETPDAKQKAE